MFVASSLLVAHCSLLGFADQLDFGSPDSRPIVEAASRFPHRGPALLGFGAYATGLIALLAFCLSRPVRPWKPPITIPELPVSAKTILTFSVTAFALVHIFSCVEVILQSRSVHPSAEEYFFYMSPAKLSGISHAHFFGHAVMYGLTSLAYLFTTTGESKKILWISLALTGGLLDVGGWWMMKFVGGAFEWVSVVAGTMSAVAWSSMALRLLYECWFLKKF